MKRRKKILLGLGIILSSFLILVLIFSMLGINSPASVRVMNKDTGNLEIGTVWNEQGIFEFEIIGVSSVSIDSFNLEDYEKKENEQAIKIDARIKNLNYDGYQIEQSTLKEIEGLKFDLTCYGKVDNSADYSPWIADYVERCSYFEKAFPLKKGEESKVSYIIFAESSVKKLEIWFCCTKENYVISSLFPTKIYKKVFETDISEL